ncbi:MAG: NAD(+)/NADH kinase [Verrucomicrobia bacterium]|nr:NAD(+)/NADH kinase [Verrucomicrobiota bacterium]
MKTLGVIANTGKPDSADVLTRLSRKAAEMDIQLLACDETADLLDDVQVVDPEKFPHQIDVLMALGGDGTMLSAVRALRGTDTPVVGVNLGSLGFMTSVTQENLEYAIDVLVEGSYTVSTRTRARATIIRDFNELKNTGPLTIS